MRRRRKLLDLARIRDVDSSGSASRKKPSTKLEKAHMTRSTALGRLRPQEDQGPWNGPEDERPRIEITHRSCVGAGSAGGAGALSKEQQQKHEKRLQLAPAPEPTQDGVDEYYEEDFPRKRPT